MARKKVFIPLQQYNLKRIFEDLKLHFRIIGKDFVILCPYHKEDTPSMYVNQTKSVFHCFGCDEKGTVEVLIDDLSEGTQPLELEHYTVAIVDSLEELMAIDNEQPTLDEDILIPFSKFTSNQVCQFSRNKFLPEMITEWNLGIDLKHLSNGQIDIDGSAITIPIRAANNQLIGVCKRYHNKQPKYQYNKGLKISLTMFGLNKIHNDTIVLVEGPRDVIVGQYLYPEFSWVASYGCHLYEEQAKYLEYKTIIIAYDMDKSGLQGAQKATNLLLGRANLKWGEFNGIKDAGDMTSRDQFIIHDLPYWALKELNYG